MKDLNKIKHDIRNHLQVIIWALQPESKAEYKSEGKKVVQAIVEALEGINGGEDAGD